MPELYSSLLADLPDAPTSPRLTTAGVRSAVALDVPEQPLDEDALIEHLQAILDNAVRPGSGGFLAYISGGGTVPGAIADLLASGLNSNPGGWALSAAPSEVEAQLIRWLASRFGLPAGAGGNLVSGGSLANLSALKLARDQANTDVRISGVGGQRLAIYASEESHFTIDRAADVLGLGESAVRKVAVDERLRMRVDDLERLVANDLAAGVKPVAIVGTAGTTGTGSIDPLVEIAAVATRVGAWFHVDAAYGGAIALSDELRPLLNGIELADSITFDTHKWLYAPVVSAAFLVRDETALLDSFSAHAAYVAQDREVADRGTDYGFEGLQLSRGFIALRVWVGLLAHGRAAYARRIEHDVALTNWLAELVEEAPELELACPTSLSICCFRYRPSGVDDDGYLDRLNHRVMTELQIDGRVFPSNAAIRGRTTIRTCIVSYRTEARHLQQLIDLTLEIGERVHASGVVT
ncbi:pyridoxal-dependent decarboxylase [Gaiella sp.]|uniref:pyridoxal phosphate-dependent decarboxylase family protein n=1 Tax=Gaiella sp. TaxID=2663207 RepID=UPI003263C8FA